MEKDVYKRQGLASVKDIYIGAVSKYMSEREDVYKRQLYMW